MERILLYRKKYYNNDSDEKNFIVKINKIKKKTSDINLIKLINKNINKINDNI